MRSESSVSRRAVLLIVVISPALLGSQVKCVAVSNPGGDPFLDPSVTTARIERIEPTVPRVGDVVRAFGSGSGTPPLEFAWDFGDGTLTIGQQAAHVYMAPGSYRVTFTVRDAGGDSASDSTQVTVSPRIASSIFSLVLVSDAVAGQPVLFAATPLEEHANALSYVWRFSGGQSAIGPRAAAIFPVAGMYLASVTATNDLGQNVVVETDFHVVDAAH